MSNIAAKVDSIYREASGRLLAYIIKIVDGNFQLAEDVLHDAVAIAIEKWSEQGIPEYPAAWLATTARNRAINVLRRKASYSKKIDHLKNEFLEAVEQKPIDPDAFPDERLSLIFTCCHPSISQEAQIALTLHTVCGLTTAQISSAFLVPVPTLAQRLVRAKKKIKEARIPYIVPEGQQLENRLSSVLHVLYLVFNAGYEAERLPESSDISLCDEAIALVRLLNGFLENRPEIIGLLALMLLHLSRRKARRDEQGQLVTLENQDRSLWDKDLIEEGKALVEQALHMGQVGPYQLQAAITALHAGAKSADDTDWPQIVGLYMLLLRMNPSPTIALNHAAAVAMAFGPERGLELLDELKSDETLKHYHLLYAAYADLQRRLGRCDEAIENYRLALALTEKPMEQQYYQSRIDKLSV